MTNPRRGASGERSQRTAARLAAQVRIRSPGTRPALGLCAPAASELARRAVISAPTVELSSAGGSHGRDAARIAPVPARSVGSRRQQSPRSTDAHGATVERRRSDLASDTVSETAGGPIGGGAVSSCGQRLVIQLIVHWRGDRPSRRRHREHRPWRARFSASRSGRSEPAGPLRRSPSTRQQIAQ